MSRISRETYAFSMSLTLSLRTVKSHAFSCSTKNNVSNVTSVLLLWWEMRVVTPVLLLLTLGLLIFMCGFIRHTTQWQCPGSKFVHSKWLCKCRLVLGSTSTQFTICGTVSFYYTRGWQHWYHIRTCVRFIAFCILFCKIIIDCELVF